MNGRVTLPCTYTGWKTTMCWGRGHCPASWCTDEIIRTDGDKVTWRKSDRYQLLGDIGQRNVSLTITGVNKQDGGTYCCRVEIHGWNNDLREEVIVKIQEETTTKPPELTSRLFNTTYDPYFPYIHPKTISAAPVPVTRKMESQDGEVKETGDNKLPHIIAAAVILIVVLVLVAVLIVRYRHCKRKTKYSESCSAIISLEGLERTEDQTEQNIYTIS
ncbi:T-cell immunoglobulin and mucin domain-containing protein 4-like isoform X2 [Dendropsophus ebraccatus]